MGEAQTAQLPTFGHEAYLVSPQAARRTTVTKLLIDECLSSELTLIARERGHHEASHVVRSRKLDLLELNDGCRMDELFRVKPPEPDVTMLRHPRF